MKRISITIPEDVYQYVQDISSSSNRSISNQISCLIRESMEGDEAWQREAEKDLRAAL